MPSAAGSAKAEPVNAAQQRVLDAAEELLRRHGPDKLSVTDVGRALGVSHAAIYRHFASRRAMIEALVRQWLERTEAPLAVIAAEDGPPAERLKRWAMTLYALKREKVGADPEMFAAYDRCVGEDGAAAAEAHQALLAAQIDGMLREGERRGEFRPIRPDDARAVFAALGGFTHPGMVLAAKGRDRSGELSAVLDLLIAGLRR